jgi:hypothetical protein
MDTVEAYPTDASAQAVRRRGTVWTDGRDDVSATGSARRPTNWPVASVLRLAVAVEIGHFALRTAKRRLETAGDCDGHGHGDGDDAGTGTGA